MSPTAPRRSTSAGELAQRIASGDRRAEAEMVKLYGERLAYLLRRWTRDNDTAAELYQETFRQALEKLRSGQLRERDRLASYLIGLAKNLALYHYRKGDRRAAFHARSDGEHDRRDEPGAGAQVADPSSGLLERLLDKEKSALVRRVLEEMPAVRDREVLSRFYLAEDDSKTICSELGLAKSHFKRVLFRARERYRALFEKEVGHLGGIGGAVS